MLRHSFCVWDNIFNASVIFICYLYKSCYDAREYVFASIALACTYILALFWCAYVFVYVRGCVCLLNIKRENVCSCSNPLTMSYAVQFIVLKQWHRLPSTFLLYYIHTSTERASERHAYTYFAFKHHARRTSKCLRIPGRISFVRSKHSNSLLWTFNSCAECFYAGAPSNNKKYTFI